MPEKDYYDILGVSPDASKEEIHKASYRYQMEVEGEERVVVGLNAFREGGEPPRIQQPDYPALEEAQRGRLGHLKASRDSSRLSHAFQAIRSAAVSGENFLPAMVQGVKARATLGEISDILREEWGTYDEA